MTARVPAGYWVVDGKHAGYRTAAPEAGHSDEHWQTARFAPAATQAVGARPFEGIRVLDLGVIVAGGELSRLFGDLAPRSSRSRVPATRTDCARSVRISRSANRSPAHIATNSGWDWNSAAPPGGLRCSAAWWPPPMRCSPTSSRELLQLLAFFPTTGCGNSTPPVWCWPKAVPSATPGRGASVWATARWCARRSA